MTAEQELRAFNTLKDDFNSRSNCDPAFRNNVAQFNRLIELSVKDTGNVYHFATVNGIIPEIVQGPPPRRADVTMAASFKHMLAILIGQINPAAALMRPDITIRGSPADLAFIKRFLLRETKSMKDLVKTLF